MVSAVSTPIRGALDQSDSYLMGQCSGLKCQARLLPGEPLDSQPALLLIILPRRQ